MPSFGNAVAGVTDMRSNIPALVRQMLPRPLPGARFGAPHALRLQRARRLCRLHRR